MQKGCRHQLSVAKWTDCWDLNIDLESNKINLSISTRTKATAVYFGLSKKVKRHRKSKHVEMQPWIPVQPLNHKIIHILFSFFFFLKRALLFHNISVRKSPKMTVENDALVQGWIISKMFSPLAEDHATLGWSADGWVPLQPQDHFDILHLSQRSVHSGGKTRCLCPPLPSRCAPPVPTDTSRKQKPTLSLIYFHWWSQQFVSTAAISLSVQSSINTVCVIFLCCCVLQCSSSVQVHSSPGSVSGHR